MIDLSGSEVMDNDYGVIPEGEYPALVEKMEWKSNYENTRQELNYQIRIVGPKYKNRVVFKKFDILTPDIEQKKKIVNSMKRMTTAFGINGDSFDEASIVNKNINVYLTVYKTTQGVEKNSVFYFKPFKVETKLSDMAKLAETTFNIKAQEVMKGDTIPF